MKRLLITLAFMCLAMPTMAADKLTEESIREFYKHSAEVLMEEEKVAVASTEKRLHEDFKMTIISSIKVQGAPPVEALMIYNKKAIISDLRFTYKTSRITKVENTVVSIEISEDGQTAHVKDKTYQVISVERPAPSETSAISTCDDEIILNAEGIIQTKAAKCRSELTIGLVEENSKPDQPSLSAPSDAPHSGSSQSSADGTAQ